jgi:hypothetical protein
MSELMETVAELNHLLEASWAEEPGPWVVVDGGGIFTTMERHVGDARPATAALIVAMHETLPQLLAAAEAVERGLALATELEATPPHPYGYDVAAQQAACRIRRALAVPTRQPVAESEERE